MKPEDDQLRGEAFRCEHCAHLGAFTRSPRNGRFYKFPPIIGAKREAHLLFVGINPRRSGTNLDLHEWLMESPTGFGQLARNVQKDGRPYIATGGGEGHYHCHMIVVEGVFGTGTTLEAKASVTELYLCANESGSALLKAGKSRCAQRYFPRVIGIVRPKVVIAVGSGVRKHLQEHFELEIRVPIVAMEHPRQLAGTSRAEKMRRMQPTIDAVLEVLRQRGCTI